MGYRPFPKNEYMRTLLRLMPQIEPKSPRGQVEQAIQRYWKIPFLSVLFLLLYMPLFPILLETWLNDSNNSHGLLVPLVSFYLVWMLKDEIKATELRPSLVGFAILVVSLVIYFASFVGDLAFPARISMITTLAGLVLYTCGWQVFKLLLFPILFLIFMVPVPVTILGLISFPLQLFVSDVSANLIDWYGIPVYQEGNLLFFARYSFEVTEACSGIRSMVSFLTLGALFAYMARDSWGKSVLLVLSAIPLAILVNMTRVTGTGILANYLGNRAAQGFLHDFSGFVVFGLGVLLMLAEVWVLNKLRSNRERSQERSV